MVPRRMFVASLIVALGTFSHSVLGQAPTFLVSCQGTESTGGGNLTYEYEVKNNTAANQNLGSFFVATDDLNLANYTNWTQPVGFASAVVPANFLWTSTVKTAHTFVSPGFVRTTVGAIQWTIPAPGLALAPGATALFGFNNPNSSEDVEWWASAGMPNFTGTNWGAPVAGPLGTFTQGPVHGPVPEPATLALLALGALPTLRRRRRWCRPMG